jgi:periplasmic divalent cation tolerance protein
MSASGDSVVLVLCTAPAAEADSLADRLLEEKLAACVNLIGPMTSRYRFEGRIETGEEMLLLIKTTAARKSALRRRIVDLHSYAVPEVLEFQADSGLPAYLGWVVDSVEP